MRSLINCNWYVKGETHERGAEEKRGRKRSLSRGDVQKLQATRRRLIMKADGTRRVTYADVQSNTKLDKSPCQRVVENALRQDGVKYRKPREKVQLTKEDAAKRLAFAKEWVKKPPGFWTSSVHAFVDNKAFQMPLTKKQKVCVYVKKRGLVGISSKVLGLTWFLQSFGSQ